MQKSSVPSVLAIPDVADALGVSKATVRRLIYSGRLRAARIGERRVGVDVRDLEQFIADAKRRCPDPIGGIQ